MPRVVFMCGPAGAGKSTVARRLENEGFVRLSFDLEAWRRGIRAMPLPPKDHVAIASYLRSRLIELVREERDVVLDFSFWSRDMRKEWRSLLAPHCVVPETVYLNTDRATCLSRVQARHMQDGDTFALAPETAAAYFDHFEVPTRDEGPLTVVGHDG